MVRQYWTMVELGCVASFHNNSTWNFSTRHTKTESFVSSLGSDEMAHDEPSQHCLSFGSALFVILF